MPRAIGPYPVKKQYGENAFEIQLPAEYNISSTFNIGDLTLYEPDKELRTILSREGGIDTNGVSKVKVPTNEMEKQNNTMDLSSTPNAYGTQRTPMDATQQSIMGLRACDKTEGAQHITKFNIKDMEGQTDSKSRATELPVKQLTLVNRLNSERGHLDREEGWNGISPHGPSHQGSRILLIVHQEACGPR